MHRVLIVDDDFMVAKIHAGFVNAAAGFTVLGAVHSAHDALEATERLKPDLVLLDIHLPDMNGLDLLQRMRAVHSEVDVIVISAAREMETVRRALRGGIVHYLMKPFGKADLLERLEHFRRTYAEIEDDTQQALAQEDVNRFFGLGSTSKSPLPKGCSAETLDLVRGLLRETSRPLSATEAAELLGTSRVSARRYLEYLADEGQAQVTLKYGGVGRPERRYSLVA